MAETTKRLSERDAAQVLQHVYNKEDASLTVNGFLAGKVGRSVTLATTTTSVADDTQVYTFSEDGNPLMEYTLIFTDGTQATLISATRTA